MTSALFAEGLLTVRPPSRDALLRFIADFVAVEKPLLDRWGIPVAGGWTRTTGTTCQILQLYRFDSFRAIEKSALAMMTDPDLPRLSEAFSWVDRPDFRYQRQLAVLSSFAKLERLDAFKGGDGATTFLEVRSRCRWGTRARAASLFRARVEAWESTGDFDLTTAYDVEYGRFGEVVVIGRLTNGASALATLDQSLDGEMRTGLGEVLVEEERHLLEPLSYSPLR